MSMPWLSYYKIVPVSLINKRKMIGSSHREFIDKAKTSCAIPDTQFIITWNKSPGYIQLLTPK